MGGRSKFTLLSSDLEFAAHFWTKVFYPCAEGELSRWKALRPRSDSLTLLQGDWMAEVYVLTAASFRETHPGLAQNCRDGSRIRLIAKNKC